MNLSRIGFDKRSVMVTWLTSYISVLLVPIIISGLLYMASWHVVESEVNRANNSALQQMEQAIDNSLGGIERLSVEIALNKQVNAFLNTSKPLTDNDYYDLFNIANDLRVYQTANDFIEQIFIYYRNSDTVISARERTDSRALYQLMGQQDGRSYEDWKSLFNKQYIQEYAPITLSEDGHSAKAVVYAKSVSLANLDQQGAVILFVIKDSKLLEKIPTSDANAIAVLDKENRLVAGSGFEQRLNFMVYNQLSEKNGFFYNRDAGTKMAVSYTTSAKTGWKYISMIPAALFNDKMTYMKKLVFASILLSLLFGGIVTILFLRKNYTPINLLIRSFSLKAGIPFSEGSNEYGFLQEALNSTFAEKEQVDRRLHQHRDVIRSHFLQGLLKGRLEPSIPMYESLSVHDMRMASPHFAVLLFHIDDYGKFQEEDYADTQKLKLIQFLILNVTEEVMGDHQQTFSTDMDDMQACIINFGEEPNKDELVRIAVEVKAFLLEHYHVHLTAAISGMHQEWLGIAEAYQETLSALAYRLVMGSGEIICYDELPSSDASVQSRSYYYPMHVEHQLINFVKAGDYEKSSAMIEQIIEANSSNALLSISLAKCLMFDLASTLLKTMDDISANGNSGNKQVVLEQMNPIERLTECETMKDMQRELQVILEHVCRSIQEDPKRELNQLSELVKAYVKDNYHEESLNISMIGGKFGLTPSYLSKQFKMQTGDALLDYISRTRIDEAKRLLRAASMSVAEIARKVGFADINTFNRTFKKIEGITPTTFKEIG
ncbi:AraC family transcriptional regulator [Paenibacillus pectinilyticus]|uniref:AraC family transcriptional regulator n=1 Tax=Paenibacillus pectinilyticus TaxID=512399 RepID=A0A1C1A4K5_9BACL|nr:helix-turn-helix domain-containing protein [Paenibacillus pectinilyticus]OCT15468.1 AraC family transcriptional regulator [Paenibacillus pectinilyticus]